MRSEDGYRSYIEGCGLPKEDQDIIHGFIEQRNAIKPTSVRTKGKQAYEAVWIANTLTTRTEEKVRAEKKGTVEYLSNCTVHGLLLVAGAASAGYTKNSRQTKIMTMKVIARYIHRFHHPIENLDLLTDDVKAGAADCDTKELITVAEWEQLINTPLPARDKAMLAMLYDGYHRPKEILNLRWTDMQVRKDDTIQYVIKFKTEIPRTIVQKSWTTRILKAWARECGAKIGETDGPVFPSTLTGDHYHTLEPLNDLVERLREKTGIAHLIPSVLRNSAMKHDCDAGLPVSYICLRAWGVPYNKMINIYMKPDSGRIQADQHKRAGIEQQSPLKDDDEESRISKLEKELHKMKRSQKLTEEFMKSHLKKES